MRSTTAFSLLLKRGRIDYFAASGSLPALLALFAADLLAKPAAVTLAELVQKSSVIVLGRLEVLSE